MHRSMEVFLNCRALFLSLVLAALVYHGAGEEASPRGSGGFSLRLVPSPGWNSTVHGVDHAGFLHVKEEEVLAALRPHVHPPRWKHMYSVSVTVGTGHGRRTYSLLLDTASSHTWMQCMPCSEPFPQTPAPFDPTASPSFRLASHKFEITARLDGARVSGVLGRDTLAFSSNDAEAKVDGAVIGCVHRSTGFHSYGVLAGVLGMGRQEPSLIWTLHNKGHGVDRFSYCLFPGPANRHGFLRFGGDVPNMSHMKSTRILNMDRKRSQDFSAYYVGVRSISVGTKRLDSRVEGALKRHKPNNGRWYGGCAIDAGTGRTKLVQLIYDILEKAVVEHVHRSGQGIPRVHRPDYPLCYHGATNVFFRYLPTVTLQFTEEDARLVIQPHQLFVRVGQDICLAVEPDPYNNVIGAMQQIDTRFVFDVAAGRMYFAPEDCHADTGDHA